MGRSGMNGGGMRWIVDVQIVADCGGAGGGAGGGATPHSPTFAEPPISIY